MRHAELGALQTALYENHWMLCGIIELPKAVGMVTHGIAMIERQTVPIGLDVRARYATASWNVREGNGGKMVGAFESGNYDLLFSEALKDMIVRSTPILRKKQLMV